MQKISQFTFKGTEINMLYRNGYLGYTFEKDGKTYGYRVKPESRSISDISNSCFLLLTNFVDTLEAVTALKQ